ncbi:MAG: MATE family efflux transporter [Bacillota bacterium]|nr:MATE family efflux transporter [Bacillota bacterium]
MNQIKEGRYSGTIIAQMFKALLPAQILSVAASTLSSIINGLVIGNNLEESALVALGFVAPMASLLGSIAMVVAGGSRILCGRYMGRNEIKKLDYVFSIAIVLDVLIGVVLSAIAILFSNQLAGLFGASGELIADTALYIRGLAIGFIPTLLIPALMAFLQMGNESSYAFCSTLVLAVLNLVFALLNINVFKGGIFGMGLASSFSQYATAIFLLIKFFTNKKLMRFDKSGFSKDMIKDMVLLGSPTALANTLYSIRNIVFNSIALSAGGSTAVAALAVINSVIGLFDAVNVGVGAVALMLSSVYVGERDRHALECLEKESLKIGWILAGVKIVIIVAFGKLIIGAFGVVGEAAAMAFALFLILAVNMPLNMTTVSIINPFQSLGRIKYSNILYIFSAIVFPLVFAYGTCNFIAEYSVWLAFIVSEALTVLVLIITAAKKCGHFPKAAGDLLWIEEDFDKGEKLSISLNTIDEVTNISERIVGFCRDNGIDERRSMFCGLCMEELAGNVVEHGFSESHRGKKMIDLFVMVDESGKLTMRIRDNSLSFDPTTRITTFNPDDPCKNIGIRMVSKIAKEMSYQQTFGMNVLSIEL